MNLEQQFSKHLKQFAAVQPRRRQLAAVSGGVDSVVLCHLLHQAGYDFAIAHCNFQLRGAESDRDEQFVRNLAATLQKEIFVTGFDTKAFADVHQLSIQVAARTLRYEWFETLRVEHALQFILTAHHANDSTETMLMNLFKGTGIAGLHGILPFQGHVFRPLLFATKKMLSQYASDNAIAFVEDSSNLGDKYTRNFFRHQLMPLLQQVYPSVEDNLLHNLDRFREVEQLYEQAIAMHKKKLLEYKGDEVHIPVLKLGKSEPVQTIYYEIVKQYGFLPAQLPDLLQLLKSETGKYVNSATHTIIRNRKWLIIAPRQAVSATTIVVENEDKLVSFEQGALAISRLVNEHPELPADQDIALLDLDAITFPLVLRRWKTGDYFYPLGMRKKKKISRFLTDRKLSKTDKEKVWVVEMNKKVVWVVGQRIDDRFKVLPETKNVLKLRWKKAH